LLPIDRHIPEILDALRARRAVVITAPPGAGKTTRVPPAIADDGPVIVLQPRRVAARTIARRIAEERGWTIGHEVGWHVRFERRFTSETRVLLATEGILTARLQQDPLLSEFVTVVLDEFHERSVHADLGLALAKQAWRARADLRIVVMSATLQTDTVSAFLDGCPVLTVPGRLHPLAIEYAAEQPIASAVADVVRRTSGSVLCFLPGAPEIERALPEVRAFVESSIEVLPLHGSLPAEEQDRAVGEAVARRVILATNIAETSLTVPAVTCVVDTGQQKTARYDPDRAIDSLVLERISADSAEQRAGRAGRLAPGLVHRLWARSDRLREHSEPEIHRIDLSEAILQIAAWGGDVRRVEWFDAPSVDRIDAGLEVLERLGAIADGRLTSIGTRMLRLPLHPRLARILIEGHGSTRVSLACAMLAERLRIPRASASSSSDLLSALETDRALTPHVREVARRLSQLVAQEERAQVLDSESTFLRAIFSGYPDRVARRRAPASDRFLLASGHGATLARESGVRDAEFIVAVDVQAGRRGEASEALIRAASRIEMEWLSPEGRGGLLRRVVEHAFDAASGCVKAFERTYYGAIVLAERPAAPDPEIVSRLLAEAYRARGMSDDDEQLLRRLRFAQLPADADALITAAVVGRSSIAQVDLASAMGPERARDLDRRAPSFIVVPSGRTVRVRYAEDGAVVVSVKLQELFGLADTPRLGPRREPVTFELLAPNGRPVQKTRDLRSFWNTTYQEVRRELRGRYPRHPWPEDPWTAPPSARPKRRGQV
jgi:ATP-dependent RNA helicase HrpB